MNKKKVLMFLFWFVVSFCYSYFFHPLFNDEIWNYGFAYNISQGLVPYVDFGMIIPPFFPFLVSIFICIFGHHLYVIHFVNSIFVSFIILFSYLKLGKKIWLFFPFVFLYLYPGYNFFCLFLLFVIFMLCDDKDKNYDILLGFLVGTIFISKQTIGICLFVPFIFYSKNKIKAICSFLLPSLIVFIYLIYNNAFYQFIDYCFLGMFDFSHQNRILLFFPLEVLIIIVLVYRLCCGHFQNKKLFYVLMFQIVTAPIFDDYHFMIGFIPVYYLFLESIQILSYRLKYYAFIVLFACFFWEYKILICDKIHFYSDSSSYLYGRNIPKYVEDSVTFLSHYLEDVTSKYDYVFLLSQNSYMVKLNTDIPIHQFDLINCGNMGYDGEEKYISKMKSMCNGKKCLFLTYSYEFGYLGDESGGQTSKKIIHYVYDNYNKIDELENVTFEVYTNEKE